MRSIFQEEPVLFEDKLNYKYPRGGGEFALHQDRWYWQNIPTRQIVSILIYLDEATAENGCLEVYPQFHQSGLFEMDGKKGITDNVFSKYSPSKAIGSAGMAIVFDSMTPHLSKENHSEKFRRGIIFSYNPKSDGCFYDAGCGLARDEHRKWLSTLTSEQVSATVS
jgi:ectoine hydroxylase-related dioxygenase (phytanoyl-CoA dioxygenase family)